MNHVPAGTYKGQIREFVMQAPKNNAQYARLKITVCDHPKYDGAEIVTWFTLGKYSDGSDGSEEGWKINKTGRDILYRSLNVLGYESPANLATLEEICREVTAEEPGVSFKLMYRGDNGQFTNVVFLRPWEGQD